MLDTNSTEALLGCSVGDHVSFCGKLIVIHAKGMDSVLVEYLKGTAHWGGVFWRWSRSSGSSYRETLADAKQAFTDYLKWCAAFWARVLDASAIIINGGCYHDGGWSEGEASCMGYGGYVYGIEEIATGRKFKTNNLWDNGHIPEEFARPDTHRFISADDCYETNPRCKVTASVDQEHIAQSW